MEPRRTDHRDLFGRAFLIHLQRGDLEMARLFARAFLLEARLSEEKEEESVAAGSP